MDYTWRDAIMDYAAPLAIVLVGIIVVIVSIIGGIALFAKPKPLDIEAVYSFNTKVVDNHNILVITRNGSLQFEAIDLGLVEAEQK
jgi:hypothetical protein